MMSTVLELENVTKRFGNVVALNDITFKVRRGQVFGYLGPNGAGKTTTIRIITGLLKPDEGTVRLFGKNPYSDDRESLEAKRNIGVVLEKPGCFPHVSVYGNLLYYGKIYGLKNVHERVIRLLKRFDLWRWRNLKAGALPDEAERKLAIARALLHDPELLIFDEPTSGLDSEGRLEIRRLLRKLARTGKTMFLSSNNFREVQEMCSHIAIINEGKIVACDELRKLRKKYAKPMIHVRFHPKIAGNRKQMKEICNDIRALGFVRNCMVKADGVLHVELEDFRFSSKLNEFLVRRGLPVLEFKKRMRSLEDLYGSLVKESG